MTTHLFNHVPHEPFEPKIFKEKEQTNSRDILDSKEGSYTWLNENEPNYDLLPEVEKFTPLEIFGFRAIWSNLDEIGLKYGKFFYSRFKPARYIHYDAPSTIGTCLNEKDILWDNDESFALQRFQGVNPSHVRKVNMPGENKLDYLVTDYSKLSRYQFIPRLRNGIIAPRCTFSLDKNGKILPVSIDFNNGWIVYRSDKRWMWRYAKLVAQTADFTHHELVDHLTKCHFITEIFAMETMKLWRNKSSHFCRLLIPHFARVLAANRGARDSLIPWIKSHLSILSPEGINNLIADEVKNFNCDDLDPHLNLINRGFSLNNLPKTYYYAHDTLRIYNILYNFYLEYLTNIKGLIDWNDIDIWSDNIRERIKSFPVILDIPSLARIITNIIFNSTVQHSAMNDPQWYFYGYVPNAPATLRKPVPRPEIAIRYKNKDWKKLYFDSLPSKGVFNLQRDLVSILSLEPPGHSSLLESTEEYRDFIPSEKITILQHSLRETGLAINLRNEYTWLDPGKITRSVIR